MAELEVMPWLGVGYGGLFIRTACVCGYSVQPLQSTKPDRLVCVCGIGHVTVWSGQLELLPVRWCELGCLRTRRSGLAFWVALLF